MQSSNFNTSIFFIPNSESGFVNSQQKFLKKNLSNEKQELALEENKSQETMKLESEKMTNNKMQVVEQLFSFITKSGQPPSYDIEKFEKQKRWRLQLSPLFLRDLNWPPALDAFSLEEALQYELTLLFERIQQAVTLPSEASLLFIKVFNHFYNRPFHPKNGTMLETFVAKLKEYLNYSSCPDLFDQVHIKDSIRALKFFSVAEELSQMTVATLRKADNSMTKEKSHNEDKGDATWEIAKYSWGKFGCFIQNLLPLVKNRMQDIDDTLDTKIFDKNFKSKIYKKYKHSQILHSKQICIAKFKKLYEKIQIIEMTISSRGKMWMQYYQTILTAFQIQQPRVKEKISETLRQLYNNLEVLQSQIGKLENLIQEIILSFESILRKEKVKITQREMKEKKRDFLFDEQNDCDRQEGEAYFVRSQLRLGKNICQLRTNEEIQPLSPNSMTRREGKSSTADSGTEIVELSYQTLFSIHIDLQFCSSSLNNFLLQLRKFEEWFGSLKLTEPQEKVLEDNWFDLQDQQEQQAIVKYMQSHSLIDKNKVSTTQTKNAKEKEKNIILQDQKEEPIKQRSFSESINNHPLSIKCQSNKTKSSFFEQFYQLPFFASACSHLSSLTSLSDSQKQIIKATYQDVHLHLTILGSVVDLIQAAHQGKEPLKFLPHFASIMARSLSIVAEQEMTAELLACKYAYATLEHHHIELAKILDQKGNQPLKQEDYLYLSKLNYGVVSHRYPHPINLSSPVKKLPCILKWLSHPQSIQLKEMQELMEQTLCFLNRHQALKSENLKELQGILQKAFSFSKIKIKKVEFSPQVLEKVNLLVARVDHLLKSIAPAIINQHSVQQKQRIKNEKLEILLNIHYHLQGLNQGLKCLVAFPTASYLLALGDNLLMHLQHLDELLEAYLYVDMNGVRLGIHDLEIYRELRGHREKGENAEIVAALNCGYGDHYPHRYRVMSYLHQKTNRNLPSAVKWRLDALDISLLEEDNDGGFLPVLSQTKNHKFRSSDELRHYLIKATARMIDLFASRLEKIS